MSLDHVSAQIIGVLTILMLIMLLVVPMVTASRRHITIAGISNGTGHAELNEAMTGASVNFRLAVAAQLERVRTMVLDYHRKVRNAPDRHYALYLPKINTSELNHQDFTLNSLVTSLEAGLPQGVASQLQALSQLVVRSRGVNVTATLHRLDPENSRLGIEVEVVSPGSQFAERRLLQEPKEPNPDMALAERIDALIQPAARCAAIDLATWTLRRPRYSFLGGKRRREGLARNMAGLLFSASASGPFAAFFQQFALAELRVAADLLRDDYPPHFNLATLREAQGEVTAGHSQYRAFMSAVSEYRAAGKAADRLPEPARAAVKRTIMVRLVRAELVSGIPRLRHDALNWLREQRLKLQLDCHFKRQRRPWPIRIIWPGNDELVLDTLTADFLYNTACMYAIAAEVTGRSDWDQHARRSLGTALMIDAGEGDLWDRASIDPDLKRLSGHLAGFMRILREALPDCRADEVPLTEIVKLVDDIGAAAGWHAAPGARADQD
jgi:hypothetical protein